MPDDLLRVGCDIGCFTAIGALEPDCLRHIGVDEQEVASTEAAGEALESASFATLVSMVTT